MVNKINNLGKQECHNEPKRCDDDTSDHQSAEEGEQDLEDPTDAKEHTGKDDNKDCQEHHYSPSCNRNPYPSKAIDIVMSPTVQLPSPNLIRSSPQSIAQS